MNEIQLPSAPPAVQLRGTLPPGKDLDSLLTPTEFATWLGITNDVLHAKVQARLIPCIRENSKLVRFHPRSYIELRLPKKKEARR